jgi:hypothetical protein
MVKVLKFAGRGWLMFDFLRLEKVFVFHIVIIIEIGFSWEFLFDGMV